MITGTRPCCTRGQTVVDQDSAETITSSPGLNLRYLLIGLQSAAIASRLADEPEFTITEFGPKASSNSRTFSPIVTLVERITATAASISSSPKVGSWSLTFIEVRDLDEDGGSALFKSALVTRDDALGIVEPHNSGVGHQQLERFGHIAGMLRAGIEWLR